MKSGNFSIINFCQRCSYVNGPMMPDNENLWVRRSKPYDLRTRVGREGALKLCIGVFEYLQSGEAEIGRLERFLRNYKRIQLSDPMSSGGIFMMSITPCKDTASRQPIKLGRFICILL
jgi:hypothetical protein